MKTCFFVFSWFSSWDSITGHMAVGQNQWYHFGVGAPPILVYFSGDWDVHWGYGILTWPYFPVFSTGPLNGKPEANG